MFQRRPRPRLNYLIRVTVILTVLTSLFVSSAVNSATVTVAPTNDNFANPQPILGAQGIILGSNVGATKELDEEDHAGRPGGASVWYRWQAPNTGRFVFTTYGSKFETLLAVYTGNSLFGLADTEVVSNDVDPFQDQGIFGSCGPRTSRVSFNAVGGVFYRLAVDGRFASTGEITLRWGRSATISGRISDASGVPTVIADVVRLGGDACRNSEGFSTVIFTDVPTGGEYTVTVSSFGKTFLRWGTDQSISPLTGNVSNYNYYQKTPAYSIKGTITMPSASDLSGLSVTCTATGAALFSTPASFISPGVYLCSSLPTNANYVVTPSKPGFRFVPTSWTETNLRDDAFGINFTGMAAPTYTISGQLKTSTGAALNGVSVALGGTHTASTSTNANGDYSFTGILEGGNYTVTPSNANFTFAPPSSSFNNVTANLTANFTANFVLQLILDESGQVVALDSMLQVKDPFPVINAANVFERGTDRNTRVVIFVTNLVLASGESASSVVINLVGSNNQTFDIPAEDVRALSNSPYTQIMFRLPDNLTDGTSTLVVKAHGLTSNIGSMTIKN